MKVIPESTKARYYDIYKDSPKASFSSDDSEARARISAWYLNDQFNLARDYGVTIEENTGREDYRSKWLLMLPKEAKQYRNDIDKMTTAIQDFWNAWRACKRYFEVTESE